MEIGNYQFFAYLIVREICVYTISTLAYMLYHWYLAFFNYRYSKLRGAVDRGVESLRFQVSTVRRQRFQILPKSARG